MSYVKIPREVYEMPSVSKDPESVAVFMYLVMRASWGDFETWFNGKKVVLKPGQLVTGRSKISEATGVNSNKVFRVLKRFEIEHLIEQQTTPHGTLISLLFWESDGESEQQTEQLVNNKRTTNAQKVNTNKRRIKEEKKIKVYSTDPEVDKAIKEYIEYRKALEPKKKFTEQAEKVLLTKLSTLSTDPATQIKILEQSIEHGWKSVYPLKEDRQPNKFNNIIQHDWDMTKLEEALLSQ